MRTLLLGAATHSSTAAAAAASLEAGAGAGPSDKGPASAAPDSDIGGGGSGGGGGGGGSGCLLQRLPRDVVEVVTGHAARPWHAWASAPAEQVLAFPTLEYDFD